jgi:hypothetical protein
MIPYGRKQLCTNGVSKEHAKGPSNMVQPPIMGNRCKCGTFPASWCRRYNKNNSRPAVLANLRAGKERPKTGSLAYIGTREDFLSLPFWKYDTG